MWDYILTFLVGAAIPTFNNWLHRRGEQKKFDIERKDKYKLVAVEKRLEVHQQAFYHWCKLRDVIHEKNSDKRGAVIADAQKFFCNNCLYLEKKTRDEFPKTIQRIINYPNLLSIWKDEERGPEKKKAHKELLENWDSIHELQNIIRRDVELEPISIKKDYPPEWETVKNDNEG